MALSPPPAGSMAAKIHQALENADLAAIGKLLADDARWGDDDHPRTCRNRSDVLATFSALLNSGVKADVLDVEEGSAGVLCELQVSWPAELDRPDDRHLFHVYLVRDGVISEIRRFDDRQSAEQAAGTSS